MEGDELENLDRETVTVTNDGDAAADLSEYTLLYGTDDQREQTYTFDEGFTLGAGESITVHTGEGADTETDVSLGSGNAVLNNEESETLVLRDPAATRSTKNRPELPTELFFCAGGDRKPTAADGCGHSARAALQPAPDAERRPSR